MKWPKSIHDWLYLNYLTWLWGVLGCYLICLILSLMVFIVDLFEFGWIIASKQLKVNMSGFSISYRHFKESKAVHEKKLERV